jgi:hypothetical protein
MVTSYEYIGANEMKVNTRTTSGITSETRYIFDDIGLVKTITSGIDPLSGAHIRNVSIRERL